MDCALTATSHAFPQLLAARDHFPENGPTSKSSRRVAQPLAAALTATAARRLAPSLGDARRA
jgi:hypothetical protein